MPRRPLTPRPSVPVLVQAAALGALTLAPLGCGDDKGGGDESNNETFDTAPTAGPCFHDGGDTPECQGTTGTDLTSGTSTGGSGPEETTFDTAPTAGPCAHDPNSPECGTTGELDSSGTGSDSSDSSGSGSGSSTGA